MSKFIGLVALAAVASYPAFAVVDEDRSVALARATLAKMTLEEKTSLLGGCATMYLNAIPRVGIVREWAFSDCGHCVKPEHRRDNFGYVDGVDDRSTALPCISALAMTWNPKLAAKHGDVMGEQMRARGKDQMLGPGINIVRTPLCGRNWEFMSEDPCLTAQMTVPLVRAVQEHGVAVTIKHFCLNNQELDRFKLGVTVDDRTLNEIYLPAFRAAVVDAGCLAVMTAYNTYNGIWCSENAYLLKGILRERWGFKGQIVTDWGAQHSCDFAVNNGCGIEMSAGRSIRYLTDFFGRAGTNKFPLATAVREGRVPVQTVDEAVLHVLYVMAKTGFLTGEQDKGERLTAKHRDVAREIGAESVVLLKNEADVLPLDRTKIRKVVLLGTLAHEEVAHLGSSCECHPPYEMTLAKGLRERLGESVEIVSYPFGSEAGDDNPLPIDGLRLETFDPNGGEAFAVRAWEYEQVRDGRLLKKGYEKAPTGEWKYNCNVKGLGPVLAGDELMWKAKVRPPESGEYEIVVEQGNIYSQAAAAVDGKPVFDWNAGKTRGFVRLEKDRVCEIVFRFRVGDVHNSCVFGWIPPSARKGSADEVRRACETADAVLVFTGTTMGYGRAKETEGSDRPNMKTALGHDEEIEKLLGWNLPRLVIVNRSGAAMEFPWADKAKTLLHLSYLGQEAGRAFADVLFGDVNPSGRLTCTWPRRYEDTAVAQCGSYCASNVIYNERFYVGYRWHDLKRIPPLFPFGYGRSYTAFDWKVEPQAQKTASGWTVRVTVTNVGKRAGKDVVQLYAAPVAPKVERCVRELKGFAKTKLLRPGESEMVEIVVTPRDLAYYDDFLHCFKADAGRYDLLVGSSVDSVRARVGIELGHDECHRP